MASLPRWAADWAVGVSVTLATLTLSVSPAGVALEGQLFGWLDHQLMRPVAVREVVVVNADGVTGRDSSAQLAERLVGARAIGVVPPVHWRLAGALARLGEETPVLFGAHGMAWSGREPVEPPAAALRFAADSVAADPIARLPSLLTGRPPRLARLDTFGIPPEARDLAPLDFAPGPRAAFRTPLLYRYGGADLLPAFALRLALHAQGLTPDPAAFEAGRLRTDLLLPTDAAHRVYPRLAGLQVPVVSAAEVIAGEVALAGAVVLVGSSEPQAAEPVWFAGGERLPLVVAEAALAAALRDGGTAVAPAWTGLAAFALVALLLAALLPRLAVGTAAVLVCFVLFIAATLEFGLLALQATFVPLLWPSAALAAGFGLVVAKRRIDRRMARVAGDLGESNRLLAQAYQALGQLDAAFERYRRCSPGAELAERLYGLGTDFERRRQFAKAAAVFERVEAMAAGFRDSAERLQRNREADQRLLGKAGATTASGTLILDTAGLARPTIGRYELERELGRGAMGAVYLGRDPKIGRTVAVKTMALAEEFEGDDLADVRERFFREAETAGRLDHPNIVTIYDVGEEQDLAYIAMDYLKGESLAAWCRADHLLPFEEVLLIAAQVADALDYAHAQGVVHRDIKPANIVYDRAAGAVKVTDFGVACLTDSSKTRTGTVLGSPSYMSPEQVAGRRLDGRSDLFSLGVTLFQLLTGDLPFKADSLASLMYQIANERHTELRSFRADLPPCLTRLLNRTLQKDPARRFASGSAMAAALRRCQAGAREDAA